MACMTTIVIDQAADDCQREATCPICHESIAIVPGHRRRVYCSDSCKQRAYLEREAQKIRETRRSQLRTTYPDFSEETIDLLDSFAAMGNYATVEHLAAAIVGEVERTTAQLQSKIERQRARIDKQNQQHHNRASELEQARADLTRLYQERAHEQEEIHQLTLRVHELAAKIQAAKRRIEELEQAPARPVMLADLLFEMGRERGFPQLWFPVDGSQHKIIEGEVYWQRFCDRAAAMDVKAAYEMINRHQTV